MLFVPMLPAVAAFRQESYERSHAYSYSTVSLKVEEIVNY